MRLRTFTAPTIKEAMAMVREAMGPDAIIVSSYERPRGRGAEVRAAVETLPVAETPPKRAEPALPSAGLALAAGLTTPQAAKPEDVVQASEKLKGIAQLARRVDRKGAPKRKEVERLARIEGTLNYHGLPAAQVANLISTVRKLETSDAADALATTLDARISFNPLSEKPRRPIMLVGAPGAGKTVTVAKLAARARLAGQSIHVITTDTLRSGAIDQLGKLMARMDSKIETADTPAALTKALARAAKTDAAIFIDTPGTNALSDGEKRDLRRFIEAGDIEPVFVFAAGGDASETAEHARLYAALGASRLLMTRLDAARRLGALLTASMEGRLAIAQVSLSPYLSEPLSALNAGTLARILFAQAKPALDAAELERAQAQSHEHTALSGKSISSEQKAS